MIHHSKLYNIYSASYLHWPNVILVQDQWKFVDLHLKIIDNKKSVLYVVIHLNHCHIKYVSTSEIYENARTYTLYTRKNYLMRPSHAELLIFMIFYQWIDLYLRKNEKFHHGLAFLPNPSTTPYLAQTKPLVRGIPPKLFQPLYECYCYKPILVPTQKTTSLSGSKAAWSLRGGTFHTWLLGRNLPLNIGMPMQIQ